MRSSWCQPDSKLNQRAWTCPSPVRNRLCCSTRLRRSCTKGYGVELPAAGGAPSIAVRSSWCQPDSKLNHSAWMWPSPLRNRLCCSARFRPSCTSVYAVGSATAAGGAINGAIRLRITWRHTAQNGTLSARILQSYSGR